MKILICIASLNGGGAERQVVYLANGLADIGFDVNILLLEGGVYISQLSKKIKSITLLGIHPTSFMLIFFTAKIFYKLKPDIIYLWQRPFDVIGGIIGLFAPFPIVHAERTDPKKVNDGIKFFLRDWIVPRSKGVIANSQAGIEYWGQKLIKLKILRVKNIVSMGSIEATHQSLLTRGMMVTVSRLHHSKNIKPLIKAIDSLRSTGVIIRLAIIGVGPEELSLKRLVKILNLEDQIIFLGYRDDALGLIKGASGFISLSLFEGQPNSVIEAAALGCPMILSSIPAHREFDDFGFVLFVNPFSEDEIKNAIKHLLSSTCMPRNFKSTAIEKFSQYSVDSVVRSHVNFFESILLER